MRAFLQSLGWFALAGLGSVGASLAFSSPALAADAVCEIAVGPHTGSNTETELCTDDFQFQVGDRIEITVRFFDQDGVFIDPDPRLQIYTLRLTQFLEDGTQPRSECDIHFDQQRECRMIRVDEGEYDYSFTPTTAAQWRFELLWYCGTEAADLCPQAGPIRVFQIEITVIQPEPKIRITSNPSGRTVVVDGVSYATPQTFPWEVGMCHTISAPSPQLGEGTRYIFKKWSDGKPQTHKICVKSPGEVYRADFEVQYWLELAASPPTAGQVTGKNWYPAGTVAQIEAKPKAGFCFVQWSSDPVPGRRTENPARVLIDKPKTLTASFSECVKITVTTDPPGLQILVDGITTNSPATFRWLVGSTHTLGADSPQPGGAGVRYIFDRWSDTGRQTHPIITPTSDTTYKAFFRPQYLLQTQVTPSVGGTVSVSSDPWFDAGAVAIVTATPAKCFGFQQWEGDAKGTANPLALVMDKPKTAIARFFTGDVTTRFETDPSGLSLLIDGVLITTPQTFTWPICSVHTLSALSPQSGPPGWKYLFSRWSDKGRPTHLFVVPGASTTVTAYFAPQCQLTVSAEPAVWGRVRPSGTVWLACGKSVTLTPRARRGATFVAWRGDASGTASPLTIVLDRPKNIIAYLNATPKANLVFAPTKPKAFEVIQFTDLSTDPNGEGDITSWHWDFGDQTTSSERHPSHVYATTGRFKPCLTVTDRYGARQTACRRLMVVVNRPPTASFTFSPANPVVGQLVTFDPATSKDPDGTVVQYAWDFGGDGTYEVAYTGYATTTRSFTQIGPTKVCLLVTDNNGASAPKCLTVNVTLPAPTAIFTALNTEEPAIAFEVHNVEIKAMRVKIFSLTGQLLFDSQEQPGPGVRWRLDGAVPNGVYLSVIWAWAADGSPMTAPLRKLVVAR